MLASNIPSKVSVPFANSGTKNAIPVPSQIGVTPGLASYTDGFPPLTFTPLASGGVPPFGADFNGILNAITQAVRWACAGGQYPYDAAFSTAVGGYPAGAIVQRADGTGEWLNLTDNNTANPETGGAGWVPMDNYGITAVTGLTNANVTLTALQYARNTITLAGTLTGNVQIIFPTTLQTWTVINNTTGAFTVTCKTAAGTGNTVPQAGGQQTFVGDGTNLVPFGGDARYAAIGTAPEPAVVRQTITSGAAAFITIGSGLSCGVLGTSTPLRLTFANGFGDSGQVDYFGKIAADNASFWTGLTANVKNYLFVDRNASTGALTAVSSTLPYIAQDSLDAISTVNGQHTYVYDVGQMYVGNGTTATAVQRVAVGECLAGASTISSVTSYAKMGRAKFVDSGTPGTTRMNKAHNIGTAPQSFSVKLRAINSNLSYLAGMEVDSPGISDSNVINCVTISADRLNAGIISNTNVLYIKEATTGTNTVITLSNWQTVFYLNRGF